MALRSVLGMMSADTWIAVNCAACALAGLVVGRWWIVVLPLVGIPLFYVGLVEGWWLWGVGDGWHRIAAETTIAGTTGALAAVAARRALSSRTTSCPPGVRATR